MTVAELAAYLDGLKKKGKREYQVMVKGENGMFLALDAGEVLIEDVWWQVWFGTKEDPTDYNVDDG